MSQENVEVVRSGFDAFNRGDLDGVLAFIADGCEWRPPSYAVDGISYHGPEGYAAWFGGLKETWSSMRLTPTFSEAGESHVIAEVRAENTGRESGTPINQRFWIVHSITEGKIARAEAFATESEALEAVGLRE